MANRIMLNETSYHGAGAVSAIPDEIKARGLKKPLVCFSSVARAAGSNKFPPAGRRPPGRKLN